MKRSGWLWVPIMGIVGMVGMMGLISCAVGPTSVAQSDPNPPPSHPLPTGVIPPAPEAQPASVPSVDAFLAWDSDAKEVTVPNGTAESHFKFILTNVSSNEVTITAANASCGCTVAKLPEYPWKLAAGVRGEISVTMNVAGKVGSISKDVNVLTDKGVKRLRVTTNLSGPPPSNQMTDGDRATNQKIAIADRQAVFKGDCARCHVEPTRGKVGKELYVSACGICHEGDHRATMVPNLHALQKPTNAEYWKTWIAYGRQGSLMPAFAEGGGGILSDAQIASLVNYLSSAIPSRSAQLTNPAPSPK